MMDEVEASRRGLGLARAGCVMALPISLMMWAVIIGLIVWLTN